jgi:DNA polymerase-3 subunit epsilon
MTRGQNSLEMDFDAPPVSLRSSNDVRPPLRIQRASAAELIDHQRVLTEIAKESKGKCLWLTLEAEATPLQ